jgi:hypothetical protein
VRSVNLSLVFAFSRGILSESHDLERLLLVEQTRPCCPAALVRAALSKYYELFPAAYGPAMTVTEQGNWLPFMSTTDVENYTGVRTQT